MNAVLLRTAVAIDELVLANRRYLRSSGLPHRETLDVLLGSFDPGVAERTATYVLEECDADPRGSDAILGAMLVLGQLEDRLVDLRRSIRWASSHASFNWWLSRRLSELSIDGIIVVPSPGGARDFQVERESSLFDAVKAANRVLDLDEEETEAFRAVRFLTLPRWDGADARWHPLSLGHEIGHLRFDDAWVRSWIAKCGDRSHGDTATAIREAKNPNRFLEPVWYTQLVEWLGEVAADSSLQSMYRENGVRSLDAYLSVHADREDTEHHPAPELRLAVLARRSLSAFQDPPTNPHIKARKEAFTKLAPRIHSAVLELLGSEGVDREQSGKVVDAALADRERGTPPAAERWPLELVVSAPSTIESGLVGSLWRPGVQDVAGTVGEMIDAVRDVSDSSAQVEDAVDFLQFAHRFHGSAREIAVSDLIVPTNVLWIGQMGVSATGEGVAGPPSADVRLGRYFIVFRRNEISTLSALQRLSDPTRIQAPVEIAWGGTFVLHPGEMVLAVTLEHLELASDCSAQVLSRSSVGRMGLLSATAVHVQPGFSGCLTLELVNLASVPIELTPGQRIAQVVAGHSMGEPATYRGKYQRQRGRPRVSEAMADDEMPVLRRIARHGGPDEIDD